MENPFYTNGRWCQQPSRRYPLSPSPSFGDAPVHRLDPLETRVSDRPVQRKPQRTKVVRIPVKSVGSAKVDRSGAAVKIQKVFRGSHVRKCLKKIKDIKREVDEIEGRLSKKEVVDLVRRDEKERLRMNENLMSLLLKLDSICGVDIGVRGCRKAVIRKAVALQERIDGIVADYLPGNGKAVDQEVESGGVDAEGTDDFFLNPKDSSEKSVSGTPVEPHKTGDESTKMDIVGDTSMIHVGVDRKLKGVSGLNPDGVQKDGSVEKSDVLIEKGERENVKKEHRVEDDNKRSRELLEGMMEDKKKMMNMMTQLFERTEMQTRLINTLTSRVEMLEKTFMGGGKLRKKMKKKMAANANANACRDD